MLGANGLTAVSGIIQSVLLTRGLGAHGYGTFTLIVTFVTVLNRLTSFRMNEFVIKYVTDARATGTDADVAAAIKFAMSVEALASLVACGAVIGLAVPAAGIFLDGEGAHLIAFYGLSVLTTLVAESSTGVLQVFNQFRVQSILSTAGTMALLASISAAYFAGAALPGMLAATLAGNLAAGFPLTIAALATARRRLGPDWWRVSLGSIRGRWAAPFRFALSTNASATLSLVTRDADPLLIGLFRSTTEVGYYRLGVAAASYALMPVSQLAQAFYPEIARKAARAEWGEFRRLLRQGSGVAAAYVLPLAVTLVFAADWLIGTVYGAEFRPAASVLLVVFIGMGFSHLLFWNRPALLAVGRADYPLKINLLVAVVKVPGIFLLIAPYGYIGTAALLTLLYLLGVGLSVVKLQAELRRRESVTPAHT